MIDELSFIVLVSVYECCVNCSFDFVSDKWKEQRSFTIERAVLGDESTDLRRVICNGFSESSLSFASIV